MTLLVQIVGAIVFFLLIIASVMLHEAGHLIPGKIFDVKTTEYFAGFGPKLWSFRRGETEYGIKAVPLGGYVRLIGMYPPDKDGVLKGSSSGFVQTMADEARAAEWEEISPEDHGRLFYEKPTWQKIVIMSGGITVNLILAFCLFLGVNGLYGTTRIQPVVATVQDCIVPATRADRTCQPGDPATPATRAGLRPGDRIVAFNGVRPGDYDQLQDLIRANLDREARITVLRDGVEVQLTPVHTVVQGLPNKLDPSRVDQAGFLGFAPTASVEKVGAGETLSQMWTMSRQALVALGSLPVKVYHVVTDIVQGHPRDPNSPMSIVGASRVAGEVAGMKELTLSDKVATGASLLGGLNLFLFWFNVIPLLPMDGGHIAGALWEWLRRSWARLRGRPDPGHVDTAKALPLVYVVGAAVFLMGLILILADVVSPVTLR